MTAGPPEFLRARRCKQGAATVNAIHKEALLTSQIEGRQATLTDLFAAVESDAFR